MRTVCQVHFPSYQVTRLWHHLAVWKMPLRWTLRLLIRQGALGLKTSLPSAYTTIQEMNTNSEWLFVCADLFSISAGVWQLVELDVKTSDGVCRTPGPWCSEKLMNTKLLLTTAVGQFIKTSALVLEKKFNLFTLKENIISVNSITSWMRLM